LALADERHALLFGASLEVYERAATALRQGVSGGVASAAAATDATGGTLLLLPREAASGAGWPQTPCFERVHDNEAWIVLARTSVSCSAER
jgi:hypothetical protein